MQVSEMSECDEVTSEFCAFKNNVNVLLVIDHAGRAGNGFFQTIFDQHPQVIACPWMHYVYSYLITKFDTTEVYNSREIWEFWKQSRYFSLLYGDLNDDQKAFVKRFGGNPDAQIDRDVVRASFDHLLLAQPTVTRQELIAAIFFSYARGLGRNTGAVKYIVCPDSISLRIESIDTGFTGKIVDLVMSDFPHARLVHLERDPRAGFASTNHQFVNQSGNMYGVRPGNYWSSILNLLKGRFDWEGPFIFGFLVVYFKKTFEAISRKREQYRDKLITVRNEDLNLDFVRTMVDLAEILEIDCLQAWTPDFQPTMLGMPWTGTGAYNSQYQTSVYGPLKNDPDKVALAVSGPNAYVTQRWRTRLSKREIFILEVALAAELKEFSYGFIFDTKRSLSLFFVFVVLMLPLRGELPSWQWICSGYKLGGREVFARIIFAAAFPAFYILSRLSFMVYSLRSGVFENKSSG